MILQDNIISKSTLAGISVCIGSYLYLILENSTLGSILFSACILGCSTFDLNLFTLKSGYISDNQDLRRSILVLLLNLCTVFILGVLFRISDLNIVDSANNIVNNRIDQNILQIIINSIIVGFLFTLSVESEKYNSNYRSYLLSIISLIPITLIGNFCLFDLFVYSTSSIAANNILFALLNLFITTIFNFIGCILYNLFIYKSIIHRD
jgi:hypothetical protein